MNQQQTSLVKHFAAKKRKRSTSVSDAKLGGSSSSDSISNSNSSNGTFKKDVRCWGKLVVCKSGTKPQLLNLVKDRYLVGRGCEVGVNDVVLGSGNRMVSQLHFKIEFSEPGFAFISDTSTNGTLVNGKRISYGSKMALSSVAEIEVMDNYFFFYQDGRMRNIEKYYIVETKVLGEGMTAKVKLAIDMKSGERLAVKIIDKGVLSKQNKLRASITDYIAQEIKILKNIAHPNIVALRDVIETTSDVYIFMPLVKGGELCDYVVEKCALPEIEAKFIFYQILLAMQYLHKNNISHRDLKLENILLEQAVPFSRILLTDFGMAKMLNTQFDLMKTKCGTLDYIAPEIISTVQPRIGYSYRVDCWSLGVILFVMLCGEYPFESELYVKSPKRFYSTIQKAEFCFNSTNKNWSSVSAEAKDLIKKLLVADPDKRLSVNECFTHPWIADKISVLEKLYRKKVEKRTQS